MIRSDRVLVIAFAAVHAACIVLPVDRIYFEPNAIDGKPIRSASCGYNRTANDGVRGIIGGVQVEIFPSFEAAGPLQVHIRVPRSGRHIELSLDRIALTTRTSTDVIRPSHSNRKNPGPYFDGIVDFVFPVEANDL